MTMNLCSMVVHIRPEALERARTRIAALDGVEVHAATPAGRLVLTVEHPDPQRFTETTTVVHNVAGVFSAALVFEYHDSEEAAQSEVSSSN